MTTATDVAPMLRQPLDTRAATVADGFEHVDTAAALAEAEAALEPYAHQGIGYPLDLDDADFAQEFEGLVGFEGSVVA
jgi:hypothetical protein